MPNIRAHRLDERTIGIGTDRYLYRSDRDVFGAGVEERWNKLPEAGGVRIAVDITAAQAQETQNALRRRDRSALGLVERTDQFVA